MPDPRSSGARDLGLARSLPVRKLFGQDPEPLKVLTTGSPGGVEVDQVV
jgi:hypothetical protein